MNGSCKCEPGIDRSAEPHSIDAAKDRRYDQNAIEMFCDRKRFINLCQLKIHQTFIFREHFLFFRWNARKLAISLRPAALDEYIESSANGFLVVVDVVISTFTTSLETITTTIIVTPPRYYYERNSLYSA